MGDLIDREKLMEKLDNMVYTARLNSDVPRQVRRVVEEIREAPAVDAVPVVRGEWIKLDAHMGMEDHKCSACKSESYVPCYGGKPMYIFCPYCGAKMDGGTK